MQKPLKAKTVEKSPARGPGTKSVLPRYVTIGNYRRKAARTVELIPGRVMADYDADGELIGVEVIG